MGWRRQNYELEAHLFKVPTPRLFRRKMGELERTSYEDGEERLKISFHGIDAPDGAVVALVIDGRTIANLPVERGAVRKIPSSREAAAVPEVKAGQTVEIHLLGKAVLAGVFRPN